MVVSFYKEKERYLTLSLHPLNPLPEAKHHLTRFEATLTHIKEDVAKYADITSGVQIELKDSSSVIQRWKETLQELLM